MATMESMDRRWCAEKVLTGDDKVEEKEEGRREVRDDAKQERKVI